MINANLITCALCRNYYADPRQIPCSHSFCFDCLSGRFDDETLILICPKCDKLHQYNSREEFENRCMRDGFLKSMVAQFKRNQSRSSAIASGLHSRPASSLSQIVPMNGFTPIRPVSQEVNSSFDQTCSERSTPSIYSQTRSSSVLPTIANRVLIAKCQSCNMKGELIVCNHCDNVICTKCADEHQSVINDDVKREWDLCKSKFDIISERSIRFEADQEECERKARELQTLVGERGDKLVQTINNYKNAYMDFIEKHRRTHKQVCAREQIIDEYESIDDRVNKLLKSADITTEKMDDFSFEIEHLESRLDSLNAILDSSELKFPVLTLPEQIDISSLFGTLNFLSLNSPHSNHVKSKPDHDDYLLLESSQPQPHRFDQISPPLPVPQAMKKKLLWQLDYKSVPYYVRTYNNQLFVCDKYGYLSVYKLNRPNDFRAKPIFVREIKLFNDNPTVLSDEDQTIIDSFVVYKFWIIVFKRKKNELHGTIYVFTYDGKLLPNGKCVHNYPSRELTIDVETNILWSLDQKQLCLFYYQLPDQISPTDQIEDVFHNRYSHVQFSKPFAPKHISVNKNVLAVLDKNRQAVHVYDKKTQEELYQHVNIYNHTTHFCWDMALFSDNSLLIKLDETSTLKAGPSKHIYLQLDTTSQRNVIGIIEETDAYGMIITATDEILIGVRINTKGTVKCYG
ncbi:unnamed protein product [Adineta ricciae]|uniref:RING-type domain-containing protein n=1 Tax=Adineta ricciae TaxID=249248 RepID=A0A813W7U5_ADIRI|nr:unnamed protein product [Adineta ricciae]CAF1011815.1 unnamed protein product [Adineta ricciae]